MHCFHEFQVKIGPVSVGYQLTEKAMVFGGSVMTATDIAVAAKLVEIGDSSKVSHIEEDLIKAAIQEMRDKLELAINQVKVSCFFIFMDNQRFFCY